MRLLFVGDEEEYGKAATKGEDGSPFSLFFCDRPPSGSGQDFDATVVPALRFLSWPAGLASGIVIASGPAGMARECFDSDCADYIREPWTEAELLARVQARSGNRLELERGLLVIDKGRLYGPRGSARLSAAMCGTLLLLSGNKGRPVPRGAIAALAEPVSANGRAIDMRMARLRSMMRSVGAPEMADRLRCEHGEYRFIC